MTTTQFSVEDETVVVTGSSRGIGRAIATKFGDDDANVVICAPEDERENLESVEERIDRGPKGSAISVVCDVRDRDSVTALFEAAAEEFGSVDVLVNNVGGGFDSPFESISANGWDAVIDLNLKGTVNCTQIAGEQMRENGRGTVVNIASYAGLKGSPYMSHYAAAKSGIINLTRTLSFEWAPYDIRINAIAPGVIDSGGNVQASVDGTEIDREEVNRTVGMPEEIADVAQFLASPASSYMTGVTVPVGGVPRFDREQRATE